MEISRRVVVFDAAELAAESAFWAAMLGGRVLTDEPAGLAHHALTHRTRWSQTFATHTPGDAAPSAAGTCRRSEDLVTVEAAAAIAEQTCAVPASASASSPSAHESGSAAAASIICTTSAIDMRARYPTDVCLQEYDDQLFLYMSDVE